MKDSFKKEKRVVYENCLEFKDTNKDVVTIDQLGHAFRINGIIDIYRKGFCVLDIERNKYHHFNNRNEIFSFIGKFISENEAKPTFNRKNKNGKITMKTFNQRKEQSEWKPEEYNWTNSKEEKSDDHLYFICDNLYRVKIGRSNNPYKRLKDLMTANAGDLTLVHVCENKGCLEKKLHFCFSDLRLNGEWFTYTKRIDDFINFVKNNS